MAAATVMTAAIGATLGRGQTANADVSGGAVTAGECLSGHDRRAGGGRAPPPSGGVPTADSASTRGANGSPSAAALTGRAGAGVEVQGPPRREDRRPHRRPPRRADGRGRRGDRRRRRVGTEGRTDGDSGNACGQRRRNSLSGRLL